MKKQVYSFLMLFAVVSAFACPALNPDNVVFDDVTTNSATISYDGATAGDMFDIKFSPNPGFDPLTEGYTKENITSAHTYSGLANNHTFEFYVRQDCAGDNSDVSPWIGPFQFTTGECDPVTDVQSELNGDGTATFVDPNGEAGVDMYDVEYGLAGFTPTGTASPESTGVTFPYTRAYELDASAYEFYVRKMCGANNYSDWSGPFTFPTAIVCEPVTDVQSVLNGDGTATFTDPNGEAGVDMYDVEYGFAGFTPTGVASPESEGVTFPYTRAYAADPSAYEFYVRKDCGDGNYSDWSGPFTFPTEAMCMAPENVTHTMVSADKYSFSDPDGEAGVDMYDVEFGFQGFMPSGTPSFSSTFPYERNVAKANYDYYVRKQCDGTMSDWAGPFNLDNSAPAARISPNPASNVVTFENFNAVSAQIFSLTGRPANANVNNNQINISNLTPGNYVIKAVDAKGNVKSFKVVKK